ncbi:hypothetical protein C7T94_18545 [Pedobacter yulinensis]|uniref:Outer membrane protein beta-barrel domain-containing protein n=1 Tax=Pedobacter yulinensis TaxID=2126353 RepID=A0A2T3HGQ0_9SPHI|nr:porin family protein [Pedobacter yulinensis]PST81618.1 hypothetical protein C7T94_18545 [Pedobacter yulinensis]
MKNFIFATAIALFTTVSVSAQTQKKAAKKATTQSRTTSQSTKRTSSSATGTKQATSTTKSTVNKKKPVTTATPAARSNYSERNETSVRPSNPPTVHTVNRSEGSRVAKTAAPRFGIRAGLNLAKYALGDGNVSGYEAADFQKNLPGLNLSVYANLNISRSFTIQPAISLQGKGTKFVIDAPGESGTMTQRTLWIEVPVNALYSIQTGNAGHLLINAGPFVSYGVSGKTRLRADSGNQDFDISFGSDVESNLSAIDYGLNGGLGFRFNNGFTVNGNYSFGLAELTPKDRRELTSSTELKSRVLSFSVGYSF